MLIAVAPACALDAPQVDLSVSPAQVAVGDPVTVTVTFRWPKGWQVPTEPEAAPWFADSFVVAAPPTRRLSLGDEERRTATLTLAAARSGAWALPRPTLTARGPQGDATATAPEVVVQVGVEAAPVALPAPRPAWTKPADAAAARRWPWYALGAAAVLLPLGAWWWWQRRRRTPPPAPRALLEQALTAAGRETDGKALGAAISLALRTYAGRLWNCDGAGLTPRELGLALRGSEITDDERAALLRLLDGLDALRWAPAALPVERIGAALADARAWADAVEARRAAAAARAQDTGAQAGAA